MGPLSLNPSRSSFPIQAETRDSMVVLTPAPLHQVGMVSPLSLVAVPQTIQTPFKWRIPRQQFLDKFNRVASKRKINLVGCCDGSSTEQGMSYGWIVAFSDGQHIAEGYDLALGISSSYRAEAFGLAAIFNGLQHILRDLDTSKLSTIHLHCDNKGIVTKFNSLLQFDEYFANTTMIRDWDVLHQARTNSKHLSASFRLHHIKGHQDRDQTKKRSTPSSTKKKLSLPAKLNIYADKLTKRVDHTQGSTLSPHLSANPAQLDINGVTISGQYSNHIRRSFSTIPILHYMANKYEWTPAILKSIHWDLHRAAIRKSTIKHSKLVKFLHDALPTNKIMAFREKWRSPNCTRCAVGTIETIDHMIKCPSAFVQRWRQQTLRLITTTSRKMAGHHDILLDILVTGLESWMLDIPLIRNKAWTGYFELVDQQTSIGWNQFF